MTTKELEACIKDLAFALRRVGIWGKKAFPSPTTDEMVEAVEKRLAAVARRLGDTD